MKKKKSGIYLKTLIGRCQNPEWWTYLVYSSIWKQKFCHSLVQYLSPHLFNIVVSFLLYCIYLRSFWLLCTLILKLWSLSVHMYISQLCSFCFLLVVFFFFSFLLFTHGGDVPAKLMVACQLPILLTCHKVWLVIVATCLSYIIILISYFF